MKMSFSQYNVFKQCPYRWKLQYLQKKRLSNISIFFTFGNAMHRTIQDYLTEYYQKSNKEMQSYDYQSKYTQHFVTEYESDKEKNNGEDFIKTEQFKHFYNDGLQTLHQLFSNPGAYFPKKDHQLVNVEYQLNLPINQQFNFIGFIDILLHNKKDDTYIIYDLKTSFKGWSDKQKKDQSKRLQLLLYKHFLSNILNIDIDKIEVKFLILKRKVFSRDFKVSRLQWFIPPSSKLTIKKKIKQFNQTLQILSEKIKTNEFECSQEKAICKLCPYYKRGEFCPKMS